MKRLWSYLPSSLSSSRSDPPQQIPDPTDDPPADQVGDTPPAPEGMQSATYLLSAYTHTLHTSFC